MAMKRANARTTGLTLAALVALTGALPCAQASPHKAAFNAPDPRCTTLARRIADRLIPDDAMARIAPQIFYMFGSPETYAQQMVNADLQAHGLPAAPLGTPPEAFLAAARILDPQFDHRLTVIAGVSAARAESSVGAVLPGLRQGYAEALARRFTLTELRQIDRFFDTNTGQAFALFSLQLPGEAPVAQRLQQLATTTLVKMPALQQRIDQELERLPQRRTMASLPAEDRRRLLTLLGMK